MTPTRTRPTIPPLVGARAWLRYDDGVGIVRFVDAVAGTVRVSWLPDPRDDETTPEEYLAVVSRPIRADRFVFDLFPPGSLAPAELAALNGAGVLRLMVRLEHCRPTRFGEPARAGLCWSVTPYTGRAADGRLLGGFLPTFHSSLSSALSYARRLAPRSRSKGTTS